jgi:hypothetical protein
MRIAVMGAGAIGGYLGARLSAADEDVTLVARGAHLEAIRRDGIRIESPHGNLHVAKIAVTDDPATIGPVDVVLFTVKLWDTEAAARALAPLMGAQTRVISLQNGIDSVDLIAGSVPREPIAAGVIYLSAGIAARGDRQSRRGAPPRRRCPARQPGRGGLRRRSRRCRRRRQDDRRDRHGDLGKIRPTDRPFRDDQFDAHDARADYGQSGNSGVPGSVGRGGGRRCCRMRR